MRTECTDTALSTDAQNAYSQSVLDQIAFTLGRRGGGEGDIWVPMAASQQSIWPRVWPGALEKRRNP
jgi:hypothetical protein